MAGGLHFLPLRWVKSCPKIYTDDRLVSNFWLQLYFYILVLPTYCQGKNTLINACTLDAKVGDTQCRSFKLERRDATSRAPSWHCDVPVLLSFSLLQHNIHRQPIKPSSDWPLYVDLDSSRQ